MCLATTQKNPRIAKKAITVYKFLDDGCSSPYQAFSYELNKVYSTIMEEGDDNSTYDDVASTALIKYNKPVRYIGPGFHAILTKNRVRKCSKEGQLYICTIPKGAQYYTDNTGLIVSNKIKIRKEYELPDN